MSPVFVAAVLAGASFVLAGPSGVATTGATGASVVTTTCRSPKPANVGTSSRTLVSAKKKRTYLLTVPPGYTGKRETPLVVVLHGSNGTGAKINATSQMPQKAGARGYVVVAPDALTPTGEQETDWNVDGALTNRPTSVATTQGEDVEFINALVDSLEKELCIDPTREYVTGKSAGAGMSMWLACQPRPRFAAVAPVAGVNDTKFCPGSNVPPLITFHGDQDTLVPYTGLTGTPLPNHGATPVLLPDVDTRMSQLASKSHCDGFADSPIGVDVIHRTWHCPGNHALELYKIIGGGHTWPGQDPASATGLGHVTNTVDATEVILDFFAKHHTHQ